MENFKNAREDKDLFPYEYGADNYNDMREVCFNLYKSKELKPDLEHLYKHMEEVGIQFFSPGGSFKRKFMVYLSQYMNHKIRSPRQGDYLKKDSKMRELLEPFAKIICA